MKARLLIVVAMASLALLALGSLFVNAEAILDQLPASPEEERQACLYDCRQWIEIFRRGSGSRSGYRADTYARCVAECERKFWKEWDKKMKDQ